VERSFFILSAKGRRPLVLLRTWKRYGQGEDGTLIKLIQHLGQGFAQIYANNLLIASKISDIKLKSEVNSPFSQTV
jgi:hypothetical protein